jgi:cytochrome c
MRIRLRCLWPGLGLFAVAAAVFSSINSDGMAQNANGPFTQAQVTAGHAGYQGYCAGCHGDELQGGGLQGGGDAPQLTGPNFTRDWSKQTIRVLYQFVSKTMPDGLAGDLNARTYSDIISFLLAANGAKPGTKPFNPNSEIKIGDITSGHIVTAVTGAPIDTKAGASQ